MTSGGEQEFPPTHIAHPDHAVDQVSGVSGSSADSSLNPPSADSAVHSRHVDGYGESLEGDGAAPNLSAVLEAVLLVTDAPVATVTLAQVLEVPTEAVRHALEALAGEYTASGRGFELRDLAGGWRLYTRGNCAPWVERFVLDGQQAKLSPAALETLAVIAYQQPVSRVRVSAVRGVNVDGVVRTLVARGLVTEVGQDAETGAVLYGTTPLLLERLGLRSLAELPALAPLLPELSELDTGSTSR